MSRPNVADWQYLGVDKITRRLEWNSDRKARKGHICEGSLAYASYSSKDSVDTTQNGFNATAMIIFVSVDLYVYLQRSLEKDRKLDECMSLCDVADLIMMPLICHDQCS